MGCRAESVALLSAYIDKEMTGQEMLEITRHLTNCGGCSAEHESFRQVKSLMSGLPQRELQSGMAYVLDEFRLTTSRSLFMSDGACAFFPQISL